MFRKLLARPQSLSQPYGQHPQSQRGRANDRVCVNNSPDGELNLRATPSKTSYTYDVLQNGECGIFNTATRSVRRIRSGTVNGQRGWVKSKWIIRAEDLELEGC
jgi:uncharacterized protein YgiM (DUF1202 family)